MAKQLRFARGQRHYGFELPNEEVGLLVTAVERTRGYGKEHVAE